MWWHCKLWIGNVHMQTTERSIVNRFETRQMVEQVGEQKEALNDSARRSWKKDRQRLQNTCKANKSVTIDEATTQAWRELVRSV
jgi:hypothetical protein